MELKINEHTTIDKYFWITSNRFAAKVDYDDVNHPETDAAIEVLAKIIKENWDEELFQTKYREKVMKIWNDNKYNLQSDFESLEDYLLGYGFKSEIEKKSEIMWDINKINGQEIIDFLNRESKDGNSDINLETNIGYNSFAFISQEIKNDVYRLKFEIDWNEMSFQENEIAIDSEGINVWLDEPFEGDGSDSIIEQALKNWLQNHKFSEKENMENEFYEIIKSSIEKLRKIKYSNSSDDLEKIIETLIKAKSLQFK